MKKVISLLFAFLMLVSLNCTAFASEEASYYLDGYYVALEAAGNGKMAITVNIEGVGKQDKIGVMCIDIDEKVTVKWVPYDSLDALDHPEFYSYGSYDYVNTIYFYGTPGHSYRVSLIVYAGKSGGSDTGFITSFEAVCT